ncbi:tetratricopeptide repeat protein [Parathalassolituus penaei]|uniref:Tetratricopeptide repeat protein n=1 Tax=Parathalassolituus penaei TaxID=2997323 RepID=A0A9X3IUW4_9GAMM|nr:tetratricopeptide repeat protein [Parathalassolituus penaei]MCY0966608.1 tetratricopeptide repeat protein [Parathalassolituus penaei]
MNPRIPEAQEHSFFEDILPLSWQQPLLLDFWASWCAPCRAILPVLEKLADEFAGRLQVVKIDADANPALCEHFTVRGLPAVLLVRFGREQARFDRTLPESEIRRFLAPFVSHPVQEALVSARALIHSGDSSSAIAMLRALARQAPADSSVLLELLQALDSESANQQARDEQAQWLAGASPEVMRDPQLQQFYHRWLLRPQAQELDSAQQMFAAQPDIGNLLQLATAQAVSGHYEEAMQRLLDVLANCAVSAIASHDQNRIRQRLIELINTCPDRALAQRIRRQWVAVSRNSYM